MDVYFNGCILSRGCALGIADLEVHCVWITCL